MKYEVDVSKYPYLIDRDDGIPYGEEDETYLNCVEDGWQKLFMETMDAVNAALDEGGVPREQFHLLQVKEKFGALRIYWAIFRDYDQLTPDDTHNRISALINDLERKTGCTCFLCGKSAEYLSKGWVLPYCKECAQSTLSNHRSVIKRIDITELFNRLYHQ